MRLLRSRCPKVFVRLPPVDDRPPAVLPAALLRETQFAGGVAGRAAMRQKAFRHIMIPRSNTAKS